jgi:hypothetical protein
MTAVVLLAVHNLEAVAAAVLPKQVIPMVVDKVVMAQPLQLPEVQ